MRLVQYPNEYKTWINKNIRKFNFEFDFNGKKLTTNELSSIKITSTLLPSDTFTIGSSVAETLEFDLIMDSDTPINKTLPVKPYLSLYTEVMIDDILTPVFQKVCLGVYYINSDGVTKKGLKSLSIKASSMMNNTDYCGRTYVATDNFNGNITVIVNDICSKLGVNLKGTLPSITISNRDNINGMTYREVLNYIAMLYGGYVKFNNEGNIEFFKMKDSGYTYDKSNYSEITKTSDETLTVKKFLCALTEDSSLSSGEGTIAETVELVNPDMTQSLLDSIKNTYLNYSYSPIKIKLLTSNPCLEVGDRIKALDQRGKTCEVPLQNIVYSLSGNGLTMEIESKYKVNSVAKGTSIRKAVNEIKTDIIKTQIVVTEEVEAINGRFDNLKSNSGEFQDLFVTNAVVDNLIADNIDAVKGEFDQIYAKKAYVGELESNIANINTAIIDKADIKDLNAFKIKASEVYATKAEIVDLDVDTLKGNIADIKTLVNGNLTSDNIQSLVLSTDKITVENGFIKNAMIENINANKISSGTLSTNQIKIASDDGGVEIIGNTQQFKDVDGNVRIQMGQDAKGDFNFILRGEDGTSVLIDNTGIKEEAISDGLIKDQMIGTGEISGSKIDISSMITEVNKDTNTSTIKGTKIFLDDKKQSLDIAFNSMSTSLDDNIEKTKTNTTSISTMQGNISTLISDSTIEKDGQTIKIKDAYSSLDQKVDGFSTSIGNNTSSINDITGDITEVKSNQTTLKQDLDGFKTTVSENYVSNEEISSLNSTIEQLSSSITTKVEASYVTKQLEPLIEQIDGKIETFSQATDPSTAWTTTALKTAHTGDIWYNTSTKVTYRYSGSAWVKLENDEAQAASALAGKKAQVFTATPTVPYYIGDLWITSLTATGVVKTCKASRTSGSYSASDWVEGLKYTDDTIASNAQATANTASTNANTANSLLADIASDSKITASEKQQLDKIMQGIISEKSSYTSQGTTYSVSTTNYTNSYNTLYNYCYGTGGILLSLTTTTNITAATLKTNFSNYYSARNTLLAGIATNSKSYSNSAASNAVNNLSIGNRNLWLNSNFEKDVTATYNGLMAYANGSIVDLADGNITGFSKAFYSNSTSCSVNFKFTKGVQTAEFLGKTFTLSCWIKYSNVTQGTNSWNVLNMFKQNRVYTKKDGTTTSTSYDTAGGYTGTSDWKRVSFQVTFGSSDDYTSMNTNFWIGFEGVAAGGEMWVTGIQIEEGNRMTTWKLAVEDTTYTFDEIYAHIASTNATTIQNSEAYTKTELGKITNYVAETYTTTSAFGEYKKQVSSDLSQTASSLTASFTQSLSAEMGDYYDFKETVSTYFEFSATGLVIGKSDSPFKTNLTNTKLAFTQNNEEIAYISNNKLYIENAEIMSTLKLGNYQFVPRDNGNLSLKWVN